MAIDYKAIGFKSGLEIHQQLEGKKLFCSCPTLNTDEKPNISFHRTLQATAGETGAVDAAASFESAKKRSFQYVGNTSDTCLLEYDECPPKNMNADALNTALTVALLLNAQPVDEIQVMRKTVVDGSNVSGFQRTSLIARNGYVETSKGTVAIDSVAIEEEACQKLQTAEGKVTYKLDRLGIPLIEIATDASIQDAEHAKETAGKIGMILRSVAGVKRGLGTIRQDVNISIKGGARIEVKGFQDLKSIPKVVDYEINRQQEIIKAGKEVTKEVRKAEPDFTTSFLRPMPGAARLYPETDVIPVRLTEETITELKRNLPELLEDKLATFTKKYNISEGVAKEVMQISYFEKLVADNSNLEPSFIAQTLIATPNELAKKHNKDVSKLNEDMFAEVLHLVNDGTVAKEAISDLLIQKLDGKDINLDDFKGVSDEELESAVKKLIADQPGKNAGAYMGDLMKQFRGKVDGKKIMQMLQKNLK